MLTFNETLIITATFYPVLHDLRCMLALLTIGLAKIQGYQIIVVESSPDKRIRKCFSQIGAIVLDEKDKGMGPSRRQAIGQATYMRPWNPDNQGPQSKIVWIEPEKYDMVQFINNLIGPIRDQQALIVYPNRTRRSWKSYPPYQERSEKAANRVYTQATGRKLDVMFGPVAFDVSQSHWFLDYVASNYGLSDRWDAHHIPPMEAMAAGVPIASVKVDFTYPPLQKAAELRDRAIKAKRQQQLTELSEAYRKVAKQLGLCGQT